MTISLGPWIFPLLVTLIAVGGALLWPTRSTDPYGIGGAIMWLSLILAAVIVSLLAWLVWAVLT